MLNEQLPRDQGWVPGVVAAAPAEAAPPARRRLRPGAVLLGLAVAALLGLVAVAAVAAGRLVPALVGLHLPRVAAVAVFLATYLVIAVGKLPGFRIDRAGAALVGASLMVGVRRAAARRGLPRDRPRHAHAAARHDDRRRQPAARPASSASSPPGRDARRPPAGAAGRRRPLTSGVLSAFLVNDAICLVLAPLVLELSPALERDPVPYLLAVAMASNVGSDGHDHRQPAEHHDRQLLAASPTGASPRRSRRWPLIGLLLDRRC